MKLRIVFAATLVALPITARAEAVGDLPAAAAPAPGTPAPGPRDARDGDGVPDQLDGAERSAYRAIFAAIRAGRWDDARTKLDAMPAGPLHAIARAELYTAKGSPKVERAPLEAWLSDRDARELPMAAQIARLASVRGATALPPLPREQRLRWVNGAPVRQRASSIRSDAAATEIALAIQPYVKADDGVNAEATVAKFGADLTPEARTEWDQKVAWIYYLGGDDADARRVAARAQAGTGEWAAQADWVQGLAAWRQKDCDRAGEAFAAVARRGDDDELRAAGEFWAARAEVACGRPQGASARLKRAAASRDTFYGLLARQTLGIEDKVQRGEIFLAADWKALAHRPAVRVAAALTEIGENDLADEVIRHQAKIGDAAEHAALTRLAGRLSLPSTQLWLAHNCPYGATPVTLAYFPAPNWTPDRGWRVDKALVFAHTLQESKFNAEVKSAAGAMGLMQVKRGAAIDVSRASGRNYANADLTDPAINMEIGQSYLEQLRDQAVTGGLLPKVIAAYNAGPSPVAEWEAGRRDGGDPLLYIESIPYWETRGYVMTVLRNYWMYELQEGRTSTSRAALAQGLWPRFPGLPGAPAVRLGDNRAANMASVRTGAH